MPNKSRLNLRADSVAEVDPACIAAFNNFIDRVDGLQRVGVHMHAKYEAAMNNPRDLEDGTGGPRLVLSFGDRGSSDAVTNWTFLFPNLAGKGKTVSSLHYRKDGAEDVSGGTREPVECVTSDPRKKKAGVDRLREPARDFMRRSSRMVNSMSFGALFGDPVEGLGGMASARDVADIRKRPKIAETASHRKAMLALVQNAGNAIRMPGAPGPGELGSLRDAAGNASATGRTGASGNEAVDAVASIYKGMEGVLDGTGYCGLDPANPLDRMMAWRVLDGRYEVVQMLRDNGPSNGGLPAELADRVTAAMLAADAAGYAPDRAALASKAMGLDALYNALDKADDDIWNAKGSAKSLDIGAYLDDTALQGLLYLSAYKEVQDHGGAYGKAPGGNGRATAVGVLSGGNAPNVYHKLCQARAEKELSDRGLVPAPKGRAYPKTVTGGLVESETRSVTKHMSYRLFREIASGEDPEMPSGAPLGRIYIGPAEKGSLGPVLCDIEPGGRGMRLADVLSGRHGNVLAGLPVLRSLGQDGFSDALINEARDILDKEGGMSTDILALEIRAFTTRRGEGGPLRRFETALRASEAQFLQRQRGGPIEAGVPTQYFYALNHSAGYPSMRYGMTDMGDGIVAEASSMVSGDAPSAAILEYANMDARSKSGKDARSFRVMDYGRQVCIDAYGPPEGGWFGHLSGNSRFYAGHAALLDACRGAGDPWAANDALMLGNCYGIWNESEMESLSDDVLSPGQAGLYRPTCKAEADVIRTCYGYAHGRTVGLPMVQPELQGTPKGFAAALAPALAAEPALRLKVVDILRAASYDEGTLARDPYGDALQILEPPQKEVQEVRAAVDAAQLNAVLESGPMAEVRRINAISDKDGGDGVPGPKTPGEE